VTEQANEEEGRWGVYFFELLRREKKKGEGKGR